MRTEQEIRDCIDNLHKTAEVARMRSEDDRYWTIMNSIADLEWVLEE